MESFGEYEYLPNKQVAGTVLQLFVWITVKCPISTVRIARWHRSLSVQVDVFINGCECKSLIIYQSKRHKNPEELKLCVTIADVK